MASLMEPDALEGIPARTIEFDSQRARRSKSVRHHALAAGFIDGRNRLIGYQDLEASLPCGNRGSEPRRSATDDKNVGAVWKSIQRVLRATGSIRVSSSR
jgi:hypothetical protein